MKPDQQSLELINRLQRQSLIVGVIAVAASLGYAFLNPAQFFRSYLFAYIFWLGITLGALAITLLHHLSGGRWGSVMRRFLEAATRTLPLMMILFIPIVLGLPHIYEWSDTVKMQATEIMRHKALYLNVPFFLVRAAIYFAVWFFLAYLLNKWSEQEDRNSTPALQSRFAFLGGIGLLLYGLTMTYASVDWMMSLEPHWASTIYGLMVLEGQALSAFAFMIIVVVLLMKHKPMSDVVAPQQLHDLGNLMFAFIMIWAYLGLSQFLIIWSGNLPEEIPWYMHRTHHGWNAIGVALIVFHFAMPFLLLLSRATKRNPRILAKIAWGVLFMRLVDIYYLIGPEFHQTGFGIHFLDFVLPVGLGGLWLHLFFRQLKSRPIVAVNDPNLSEVLAHAES